MCIVLEKAAMQFVLDLVRQQVPFRYINIWFEERRTGTLTFGSTGMYRLGISREIPTAVIESTDIFTHSNHPSFRSIGCRVYVASGHTSRYMNKNQMASNIKTSWLLAIATQGRRTVIVISDKRAR